MAIRVALQHRTSYRFDRPVKLAPHEIRLRPAPHCRTPVLGYSLNVAPEPYFLNWQQDPYGNWIARLVFPEPATALEVTVDLVADMTVINPFDFFVEPAAEAYPFKYAAALAKELLPFREVSPPGPRLAAWLDAFRATIVPGENTVTMLVRLNQQLQHEIRYLVRMEPGVQDPDDTLERACGSCRDTGWLLVQILRHLGLAARFASGYLIQLVADVKPLDGPAGTDHDFTDLHAWAEAYLPGAGWIGLDPTSGLLAGEGHLPLACTADPGNAAPVIGFTDPCQVEFSFAMSVTRVHEDPRVTRPYSEVQWAAIDALGQRIDADLATHDVRLTQGGEPTFVSIDDMDGAEWNYTALSPRKRELGESLLRRLAGRFAPGGFLHTGQGKWYPGEPLPRWAIGAYWRADGVPLWNDPLRLADTRTPGRDDIGTAQRLANTLAEALGLDAKYVMTAYEDVPKLLVGEAALPANLDPLQADLSQPTERARLARLLQQGAGRPAGFVLPLRAVERAEGVLWETQPVARSPRASLCARRRLAARPAPPARLAARSAAGRGGRRAAHRSVRAPRRAAGIGYRSRNCGAREGEARGGREGRRQDRALRRSARRPPPRVHAAAGPPRRLRCAARGGRAGRCVAGLCGRDRGLHAAARSAAQGPERDAGPGRDRGQHPSRLDVERARRNNRDALRGGAAVAARHREVHARRPPHRHRRRQSRDAGRAPRRPTARSCAAPICCRA